MKAHPARLRREQCSACSMRIIGAALVTLRFASSPRRIHIPQRLRTSRRRPRRPDRTRRPRRHALDGLRRRKRLGPMVDDGRQRPRRSRLSRHVVARRHRASEVADRKAQSASRRRPWLSPKSDTSTDATTDVHWLVTGNRRVQLQPLTNAAPYHVRVQRIDALGEITSLPTEMTFDGGDATRVDALRASMTHFDDFNLRLGPADETLWNNATVTSTDAASISSSSTISSRAHVERHARRRHRRPLADVAAFPQTGAHRERRAPAHRVRHG